MIKLENYEVLGWEHAIRGMRNPMNSWDRSDSMFGCVDLDCDKCLNNWQQSSYYMEDGNDYMKCDGYGLNIGPNDHERMMKLSKGGPVHAKYRRFITVYVDITAPLYWWKEFDTYRTGVTPNPMDIEMNSCSTMHKIADKEFTMEDFSCEHLLDVGERDVMTIRPNDSGDMEGWGPLDIMYLIVESLNVNRQNYNETIEKMKNTTDVAEKLTLKKLAKKYWWQMIQLLPSSYNQKRTVMLNYEVLTNIYEYRKNHKLDEWRDFCKWIESLPYSEIITGGIDNETTAVN